MRDPDRIDSNIAKNDRNYFLAELGLTLLMWFAIDLAVFSIYVSIVQFVSPGPK